MDQRLCDHLENWNQLLEPQARQCDECVKTGGVWVHLRTCQTCGATLCCDSSSNRHASKHAHAQHHYVAISAESGERWAWCYKDEQFVNY